MTRAEKIEGAARELLRQHLTLHPDSHLYMIIDEIQALSTALSAPREDEHAPAADYMHGAPPAPMLTGARSDRIHKEVGTGRAAKVGKAQRVEDAEKRGGRCPECHDEHFDMAGNRMPCARCAGSGKQGGGRG